MAPILQISPQILPPAGPTAASIAGSPDSAKPVLASQTTGGASSAASGALFAAVLDDAASHHLVTASIGPAGAAGIATGACVSLFPVAPQAALSPTQPLPAPPGTRDEAADPAGRQPVSQSGQEPDKPDPSEQTRLANQAPTPDARSAAPTARRPDRSAIHAGKASELQERSPNHGQQQPAALPTLLPSPAAPTGPACLSLALSVTSDTPAIEALGTSSGGASAPGDVKAIPDARATRHASNAKRQTEPDNSVPPPPPLVSAVIDQIAGQTPPSRAASAKSPPPSNPTPAQGAEFAAFPAQAAPFSGHSGLLPTRAPIDRPEFTVSAPRVDQQASVRWQSGGGRQSNTKLEAPQDPSPARPEQSGPVGDPSARAEPRRIVENIASTGPTAPRATPTGDLTAAPPAVSALPESASPPGAELLTNAIESWPKMEPVKSDPREAATIAQTSPNDIETDFALIPASKQPPAPAPPAETSVEFSSAVRSATGTGRHAP